MKSSFSENLKLARKVRGYTQKFVAGKIGVSNSTYSLYESGEREPGISTIGKIAQVLYVSIDELFGLYNFGTENLIRETAEKYKSEPGCSWEEFYGLPDGERAELVKGELFYMSAPGRIHQKLVSELNVTLVNYIRSKKGVCEVYPAPFAVKLSEEDNIIVQPDISVICDKNKLDDKGCNGAPNLIIEVTSPSNKKRDFIDKLKLYSDYGVEEYWIVDPDLKKVVVYYMENENITPSIYGFENEIKVNIFDDLYIQLDRYFT